jgi:hypothetical protein
MDVSQTCACRTKVDPKELADAMPRLLPRRGSAAPAELSGFEEEEASSHLVELPEADMARLRQMQQTHACLFAAQKQRVQALPGFHICL